MSDEGKDEFLTEVLKVDKEHLDQALDRLIDSVSGFKSRGMDMFIEDESDLWVALKNDLDFANFIISGLMYSHGMVPCDHDNEEEDEE